MRVIDFSVVVPAYNEALYLEPTLKSVRHQDFTGDIELIVVDNNSSDDTARVAGRYADQVLHYDEKQGASAARQHGAERARGKNIVFLDADTLMSPNLLSEAAKSLADGYLGGCAPIQVQDDSFGARWTELVVNNWHRFVGPTFIPYIYCTREVFHRAGGWDLDITCAEEVRLQKRIREFGKLAWNRHACTQTDARRYRAEGYFQLAFKGLLAQFLGMNLTWRPIRALPALSHSGETPLRAGR